MYAAPRKLCRQDLLGAATELQQSCNRASSAGRTCSYTHVFSSGGESWHWSFCLRRAKHCICIRAHTHTHTLSLSFSRSLSFSLSLSLSLTHTHSLFAGYAGDAGRTCSYIHVVSCRVSYLTHTHYIKKCSATELQQLLTLPTHTTYM